MKDVLAIIPARGGSKGVPGKNKRMLDGKPLIAYAIETALTSQLITHILVNTDSIEIASVAHSYGVQTLMRPADQGLDDSPIYPVIESSLFFAESSEQKTFDYILLLQPTTPFRTGLEADNAIQLIFDHPSIDGIISVNKVDDHHPSRMYTIDGENKLHPIWSNGETQNRQSLDEVYIRNGAFYLARRNAMLSEKKIMLQNKLAMIMSSEWQVNIDTEKDFLLAELIVKKWKKEKGLTS